MTYAYMPGPEQPNTDIQMIKGQAIAGCAIGIVVLDLWYPYVPGNVANGSTFNFPVLFKILKGSTGKQVSTSDPILLDMIVEAGKEFEQQGVRAIVGACGFFANFQKAASERLNLPTFLSSMLQIPIVAQGLKPDQQVGILTAMASTLTPKVLNQCGVDDLSRVAIQDCPEFFERKRDSAGRFTGRFNSYEVEQEIVGQAKELVSKNPNVGAIVLECSDLPPYAWAIQNAVRLPVFDFTSMINWIYYGVVRHPFAGFV